MDRISALEPLSRLPTEVLEELLARYGALVEYSADDHVHVEGQQDETVSYLLSGRVQRSVDGKVFDILDGRVARLARVEVDGRFGPVYELYRNVVLGGQARARSGLRELWQTHSAREQTQSGARTDQPEQRLKIGSTGRSSR